MCFTTSSHKDAAGIKKGQWSLDDTKPPPRHLFVLYVSVRLT
jgi:hypothetical protein